MGRGAHSLAPFSMSFGEDTITEDGHHSVAMGWGSFASGIDKSGTNVAGLKEYGAISMGYDCSATGLNAFAVGSGSDASGNFSIAIGTGVNAVPASGGLSIATPNLASGHWSTAIGALNTAGSLYGIAIGYNNTVHTAATNGIAIGHDAQISSGGLGGIVFQGAKCYAPMGFAAQNSAVYGTKSVAFMQSDVSGEGSFAAGILADCSGNHASAIGVGVHAPYLSQHVVGRYNTLRNATIADAGNYNVNNPAFVIGGGMGNTNRKDLFTVSYSGRTDISGTLNVLKHTAAPTITRLLADVDNHIIDLCSNMITIGA
jgi:hypothetical protein